MSLQLTTSAFETGQIIPKKYTGEGEDLSPPLKWEGIPSGTKEFALICEDPDAPGNEPFVHWLIYNIPPQMTSLSEGISPVGLIPDLTQGKNSFGKLGYGGPMPPIGHGVHHYKFIIYALDVELNLPASLSKEQLLKNIKNHILDSSELIGTYERGSKRATA